MDSTDSKRKRRNVYISFNAEALWHLGVDKCVQLATRDIRAFGGDVLNFQPSRCDLSADFFIPGDLSLLFLNSHKVCRRSSQRQFLSDDKLETFYIGTTCAPVQLRIYDKGKEILKSGKPWFQKFWGKENPTCVWRIEFQLRRTVLREFRIETVDCLPSIAARTDTVSLNDALNNLTTQIIEYWFERDFKDEVQKRTIKLGKHSTEESG